MIMERANYFPEIVNVALAEGFSAMRTGILNGIKFISMTHYANSPGIYNYQLRLVGLQPLFRFRHIRKYFYPLNHYFRLWILDCRIEPQISI